MYTAYIKRVLNGLGFLSFATMLLIVVPPLIKSTDFIAAFAGICLAWIGIGVLALWGWHVFIVPNYQGEE